MGETISPEKKDFVIKTIRSFFPNAEILAFGSRVKGTARKYSDLDIALKDADELPKKEWYALEGAFEESDLPFKVDLLEFRSVSADFRKIIEKSCEKW